MTVHGSTTLFPFWNIILKWFDLLAKNIECLCNYNQIFVILLIHAVVFESNMSHLSAHNMISDLK